MSSRKRTRRPESSTPRRNLDKADATAFEWTVQQAPEIELLEIGTPDQTGDVYHVQRMGILRPDFSAGPLSVPQGTPWMQTTDGKTYQLPSSLQAAVYDLVALALGSGGGTASGMFPADIEFGTIGGRAYAHFAE